MHLECAMCGNLVVVSHVLVAGRFVALVRRHALGRNDVKIGSRDRYVHGPRSTNINSCVQFDPNEHISLL